MKIIKTSGFKQAKNEIVHFETTIGSTPVTAHIEVEKGIGKLRGPGGSISEPPEPDLFYVLKIIDDNTGAELPVEKYEEGILGKFELLAPDYL